MKLEDLLAREEIKQLKARYCYHLDYQEWEAYADLFTEVTPTPPSRPRAGMANLGR